MISHTRRCCNPQQDRSILLQASLNGLTSLTLYHTGEDLLQVLHLSVQVVLARLISCSMQCCGLPFCRTILVALCSHAQRRHQNVGAWSLQKLLHMPACTMLQLSLHLFSSDKGTCGSTSKTMSVCQTFGLQCCSSLKNQTASCKLQSANL